jgi:hypothetical protein
MIPVGHHMVAIDHEGGDGAALNDLGEGFFRFRMQLAFDLFEPAVAAAFRDVRRFAKAEVELLADRFRGDLFVGQRVKRILTNGFQLKKVPQVPANPDGRSNPHGPV